MRDRTTPVLMALLIAAFPAPSLAAQTASQATQAPSTARKLFVFVYRPGPNWAHGLPMAKQNLRPHGVYFADLLRTGRVFAGGGFVGRDGGMAIVRAADLDEARAMLEADPAISGGIFAADLHEWSPRFHTRDALVEAPTQTTSAK